MTLVCATHHRSVPVLLGDVLLSGNRPDHAEVATVDNVERLSFDAPSLGELQLAFKKYEEIDPGSPVELVGSLVFDDANYTIFHWDGGLKSGNFETGSSFVSGSGSETFKTRITAPEYNAESDNHTPDTGAASWALLHICAMLGEEILWDANLPDYFGGGFDVVFFDGSTFRRVASIVQIFLGLNVVSLGRPAEVAPSGAQLVTRYEWKIQCTMFCQSFQNGRLILERVDLKENPLIYSTTKSWADIKYIRRAQAPVFDGLDCSERTPSEPNFALIHRRIYAGTTGFAIGSSVYKLPNVDVTISRYKRSIRLRYSRKFLEDQTRDMLAAFDSLGNREKVEEAIARRELPPWGSGSTNEQSIKYVFRM